MKTFPTRLIMSGLLFAALLAHGGPVPGEVNYQGQILNAAGTPLATGNYTLTFTLFDAAQGGSVVWGPYTNSAVAVVDGSFNVVLPAQDYLSRTLAAAAINSPRFLELAVGNNPPIAPRQQLLSAPFALNSERMQGYGWDAFFDNANPATGKIAGSRIADGSVTTSQLANNAVTSAKITDGTITTADILDGTIATADLANSSVTSAKIGTGQIITTHILDGTITSADIADATIATADLADNVVTSAKIADGTIQQTDLGIVYRLTASDGSPTNALQVDAEGNIVASGNISCLTINNATLGADYLKLSKTVNVFPGGGYPVIDLVSHYGLPSRDYHTLLIGRDTKLEIQCTGLIVSNLTTGTAIPVYYDSVSKEIIQQTSSRRFKDNIKPWREDAYQLLKLEPKTFMRQGNPGKLEVGYIAEEADAAGLRPVTVYDAKGQPEAIDYARLILYANEILKDQQQRLKSQEREIQSLKGELEALKSALQAPGHRQQ